MGPEGLAGGSIRFFPAAMAPIIMPSECNLHTETGTSGWQEGFAMGSCQQK